MTRWFEKVKLATQDRPATVEQIRNLWRNLDFIRETWRSTLWSQTWNSSAAPATNSLFRTPTVNLPPGMARLKAIFICTGSGGLSFTVNVRGAGNYQTFTVSGTRSGAYTVIYDVNLPWVEYGSRSDYSGAYIEWQGNASGDLLYVGFFAGFNELPLSVQQFEVADSGHLRPVAETLNWLATRQQFLGGWCGTAAGLEMASDAYTTYFQHYHLFDKSDDTLSLDKLYVIRTLASATAKTTTARSFAMKNVFRESGQSVTVGPDSGDNYTYREMEMASSSAYQETYSTGAGAESAVTTQYVRGAGDNKIYLNGWMLNAVDYNPLPITRTQNASGAVADPDYWACTQGEWIDTDNISAIGRALFNAVLLKSGQYTALMEPPSGRSISLTTSFATLCRTAVVNAGLWLVSILAQYRVPYTLTAIITASGSATVELKVTTSGGNTDTRAFTLASGVNYVSDSGTILTSASRGFDDLKIEIRDKNSPSTITLHSLVIQLRYAATW